MCCVQRCGPSGLLLVLPMCKWFVLGRAQQLTALGFYLRCHLSLFVALRILVCLHVHVQLPPVGALLCIPFALCVAVVLCHDSRCMYTKRQGLGSAAGAFLSLLLYSPGVVPEFKNGVIAVLEVW